MGTPKLGNPHLTPRRFNTVFGFFLIAFVIQLPGTASSELLPSASPDSRVATTQSGEQPKDVEVRTTSAEKSETDGKPAKAVPASMRGSSAPTTYRSLIEKEAAGTGLAPEVAEAVMAVESGYNPAAIGGVGEIGLMQILPSTARMLGFVGTNADLAVPETNIHYGITYLSRAWRLAGGDLCTAVMKYRAGHGETRFSFLSVNYCLAVRSKLAARGFRVAGNVPVATFGDPGSGGCRRKCLAGSRVGHVNLAALNTKLSALVIQVRATR